MLLTTEVDTSYDNTQVDRISLNYVVVYTNYEPMVICVNCHNGLIWGPTIQGNGNIINDSATSQIVYMTCLVHIISNSH